MRSARADIGINVIAKAIIQMRSMVISYPGGLRPERTHRARAGLLAVAGKVDQQPLPGEQVPAVRTTNVDSAGPRPSAWQELPWADARQPEKTMQYMLLIYGDEAAWNQMSQAQIAQVMQAYSTYTADLAAAGVLRGGSELAPVATATTVRVRNGKPLLTDGPFAETREQLGGYYLIDVPDLDSAVKWAARIPSATMGAIEVRPLTENQAEVPA
jgi:hypothetical protein